jgi:S1-C subfamily serine protease
MGLKELEKPKDVKMKSAILPLVLLLVCFSFLPACCSRAPSVESLNRVSVSLVEPVDGDYKAYCSGTFISSYQILTARHCVIALAELKDVEPETLHIHYILSDEVTGHDTEPSALHLAMVQKLDKDHDLATLALPKQGKPFHSSAEIGDLPEVGDAVLSVSTPNGLYFSFAKGTVSQIWDDYADRGQMIEANVAIWYGSSGSGLFDKHGNLIGVCDRLSGVPGQYMFIGTDSIKRFLEHLDDPSLD